MNPSATPENYTTLTDVTAARHRYDVDPAGSNPSILCFDVPR